MSTSQLSSRPPVDKPRNIPRSQRKNRGPHDVPIALGIGHRALAFSARILPQYRLERTARLSYSNSEARHGQD
jgi:hypothetical protein